MQLYEFQAKKVFQQNGIPIPKGRLARTAKDAAKVAEELGDALVIKAQVLTGGRGLAGGVKFADSPEQAEKIASGILRSVIRGERPRAVLVEERLKPLRELYTGVTYDFRRKRPVVISSSQGGVDIETVSREHPGAIARKLIDPFKRFEPYVGRELATEIGLQGNKVNEYAHIVSCLWRIFEQCDAELVEANPLAITGDRLVALDAKLNLDDKSVFRQSDFLKSIEPMPTDQGEGYEVRRSRARELGIPTYIEMQGNLGVIADGAGTGMLTLDLVTDSDGKMGVYCEMGGEATSELMENAMKAILSVNSTRVVLINLIGGLNRMDEMAEGITSYLRNHPTKIPVVIRMSGTMEEEGRRILSAAGIQAYDNLYEAVEKALHLSR